jgi:hypothetical protein
MKQTLQATLLPFDLPSFKQAWEIVKGDLRAEINRGEFDTWVNPMQPIGYQDGMYTLGVYNSFAKEWVESRLKSRMTQLLRAVFHEDLNIRVVVISEVYPTGDASARPAQESQHEEAVVTLLEGEKEKPRTKEREKPEASTRKVSLQKAYGSQRAALVQPDRTLYITLYFWTNWLPLLGHSALATIIAARSMCYWNPMTGELRNRVQTDMSEIAKRASVSVRTVKEVLANELVRRYFLRYKVRRVMTSNGIRTAGIDLLVRMDDPLTPDDQSAHNLAEEEHWYTFDFEDEDEEI